MTLQGSGFAIRITIKIRITIRGLGNGAGSSGRSYGAKGLLLGRRAPMVRSLAHSDWNHVKDLAARDGAGGVGLDRLRADENRYD